MAGLMLSIQLLKITTVEKPRFSTMTKELNVKWAWRRLFGSLTGEFQCVKNVQQNSQFWFEDIIAELVVKLFAQIVLPIKHP